MSLDQSDRSVHATNQTSDCKLVRYDRAGKWYVEDFYLGRSLIGIEAAARLARHWESNGGAIRFGVPGGSRFDALVRRLA